MYSQLKQGDCFKNMLLFLELLQNPAMLMETAFAFELERYSL